MKLIISILIALALMLYASYPHISFKPFKISFENGWLALGMLLICIGVGLVRYSGAIHERNRVINQVINIIEEEQETSKE